jgi:hypothetical protein
MKEGSFTYSRKDMNMIPIPNLESSNEDQVKQDAFGHAWHHVRTLESVALSLRKGMPQG